MKIIDPHLHLFDLKQGDYAWLKAGNPPLWSDKALINKSFDEQYLKLEAPLSLAGFVHIEAGFDNQRPWRELDYLQKSCLLPFAAIANIDLTIDSDSFSQQLERLSRFASFIGVRHILDNSAFNLLTSKQVLTNISLLESTSKAQEDKLVFEVQMSLADHIGVNALCDVIATNSNINFIINHAGFPVTTINSIEWKNWQASLVKLACFPHVAVKCSGWEMSDRDYDRNLQWLNLTLQVCFTAFGKERMMLASNFPLCLFTHSDYQSYWQYLLSTDFIKNINSQEKNALCYHNAFHYYHRKL